ncbi:MAG TPA: DUF1223 domain-containing protein [Gammaproteobacteria bacterium]
MLVRICCLLISGLLITTTARADIHLESGEQQQIMLELFTSEGCSSCPPAEKYLNEFYNHPKLWKPYIPLAFHVDYWDYLGWRDVYAKREYSERQRHYGRTLNVRTIYTPEFFVNGKEWRSGFYTRLPEIKTRIVGNLKVDIKGQSITAMFLPSQTTMNNTVLNIAVLGMDFRSQIKAGENRGRDTTHQFVVLAHETVIGNNNTWKINLPALQQNNISRPKAVVVWISEQGSPVPIQSLGGFVSGEKNPE